MSEVKMVKRAKVILKGAKTYNVGGQRFVKDVPTIVKGSLVDELRSNGYFKFIELESKEVKSSKADVSSNDDSTKKKLKKKSSGKKSK